MKAGILTVWLEGGGLHSVADASLEPILKMADKIRKDRVVSVGKKEVNVVEAVVLKYNGGDAYAVKRFNCRAEGNRERIVAEQKKAAKAAEAKA
jgi:hypothetical protein